MLATAKSFQKLSVLLPVRNKARQLSSLVERLLRTPIGLPLELVIVDDGSNDGSGEVISKLAEADARIQAVFLPQRQGVSAAVRSAVAQMSGDLVLILADGREPAPADVAALLQPLLDGEADAVLGSRLLSARFRRVLGFWEALGRRFLALCANVFNNVNLSDLKGGCLAVRGDVLRAIPLTGGSAFEAELICKLAPWGLRLCEVPLVGQAAEEAERAAGSASIFRDLWGLVKYRFFARRFTTHEGFFILQSVRKARGLNRWMIRQLAPFLGRRLLEAGCGIGNLSELLLDRDRLVCVDNDPFYVDRIGRRFGHLEHVAVAEADLARLEECPDLAAGGFDTVICINVLEHIEEDVRVLRHFNRVLQDGGHAVILVPAHPGLYSGIDRALGHCRRYTRRELESKMRAAGFAVVHVQGFNRLGTLGWYFSGKLLGRTTLSPGQMKLYDWLLPLAKRIENLPLWPHLSLIMVGRKPALAALNIPESPKQAA